MQGGDTHLVTAQDPIVSLFHSGEHSWAASALGHQQTSQFMSSEKVKLSWSVKWAGRAEVCPGAWLLPHQLSKPGNSTNKYAKSGTGCVTRPVWGRCREFLSCYWLSYYMKAMKEMDIVIGSWLCLQNLHIKLWERLLLNALFNCSPWFAALFSDTCYSCQSLCQNILQVTWKIIYQQITESS